MTGVMQMCHQVGHQGRGITTCIVWFFLRDAFSPLDAAKSHALRLLILRCSGPEGFQSQALLLTPLTSATHHFQHRCENVSKGTAPDLYPTQNSAETRV